MVTRVLAIIENGHRGGLETQFADVFYLVRELNRQIGRIDVLLRGPAVTCALDAVKPDAAEREDRRLRAGPTLARLPDVRASVRNLLGDGMAVAVDGADLSALGLPSDRLIDGVAVTDGEADATRWLDYDGVWFL
jgi:intracellular sulfur oxidation DsrE/DsrF family protein